MHTTPFTDLSMTLMSYAKDFLCYIPKEYLEKLINKIDNIIARIDFDKIDNIENTRYDIISDVTRITSKESMHEYFTKHYDGVAACEDKMKNYRVKISMPDFYMSSDAMNFDNCLAKRFKISSQGVMTTYLVIVDDENAEVTEFDMKILRRTSNMLSLYMSNDRIIDGNTYPRYTSKSNSYTIIAYVNNNPRSAFSSMFEGSSQTNTIRKDRCFATPSGSTMGRMKEYETYVSVVTRKQMMLSLLTHEMLHFFDIDENGMLRYDVDRFVSDHLNETIAQGMATYVHALLTTYEVHSFLLRGERIDLLRKLLIKEYSWAFIQTARVLKINGINDINDEILSTLKNTNWHDQSLLFEYVIARIAFLLQIDYFLKNKSLLRHAQIFLCNIKPSFTMTGMHKKINQIVNMIDSSCNSHNKLKELLRDTLDPYRKMTNIVESCLTSTYVTKMILLACEYERTIKVIDTNLRCGNMEMEYTTIDAKN